jgi:hypothetical protein
MRSTRFSCAIAMTRSESSFVRLEQDFTGRRIDDVRHGEGAFALRLGQLDGLDARLLQRFDLILADLLAGVQRQFGSGIGNSAADRRPTSESVTFHWIRPSFITSSSVV